MDPNRPAKFGGSPDRRRRESDEEDEDESTARVPNRDRSRQHQGTDRRRRESDEEDENENTVRVPNRDRSRRRQSTDRRRRESDEEDESTVRIPNRDQSRQPQGRRQSDAERRRQRMMTRSPLSQVSNAVTICREWIVGPTSQNPPTQSQHERLQRHIRRVNQRIAVWNYHVGSPTSQSAPENPSDTSSIESPPTYEVQVVDPYSQVGQQIADISDQCPIGTPQVDQMGVQSMTEFEAEVQRYIQTTGPSAYRSTPIRPNRQSRASPGRSGSNHPSLDDFNPNEDSGPRIIVCGGFDNANPVYLTPPPRVDTPPPGSPNVPGYQPPRTPPPPYRTPPPRYALQSACATNTPSRLISYSPSSYPVSPTPDYTRFYHPPAWRQNPPSHFSASLPSTSSQPPPQKRRREESGSDDNSEDQWSPVLSRPQKRRREESESE